MIASLNTWARPGCPSAPSRAPIREPCGALDRPFPREVPHAHKRKVSDIRLQAREGSAFPTFSVASSAVPLRVRGGLAFSPCGNSQFVSTARSLSGLYVDLYVDSRGKEGWSDRRMFRGGRSVARLAACESLGFRLAPRPLLHKAGENRRLTACMFKLDRRRYRVGEPEPA